MISEHRFHELKEDKIHYAYVCVEIKLNTGYTACSNTFMETEFDNIPSSWIMAALEGIIEAAEMSVNKGLINNLVVRLINLNGAEQETNIELIKCAAINAVWKVLAPQNKPLKIAYSNKTWCIEYPPLGVAS